MGPALCDVFAEHGATVIADTSSLIDPEVANEVIADAGVIDILIGNLAIAAPSTPAAAASETE